MQGNVSNSGSPLLNLPAEIRNTIYDFAANFDPEHEKPVFRIVDLWFDRADSADSAVSDRYFPLWHTDAMGLTQTCKVLRAEFRPIFMRNARFRTHIKLSTSFIETFLAGTLKLSNQDYGHICVDPFTADLDTKPYVNSKGLYNQNILPLLQLFIISTPSQCQVLGKSNYGFVRPANEDSMLAREQAMMKDLCEVHLRVGWQFIFKADCKHSWVRRLPVHGKLYAPDWRSKAGTPLEFDDLIDYVETFGWGTRYPNYLLPGAYVCKCKTHNPDTQG